MPSYYLSPHGPSVAPSFKCCYSKRASYLLKKTSSPAATALTTVAELEVNARFFHPDLHPSNHSQSEGHSTKQSRASGSAASQAPGTTGPRDAKTWRMRSLPLPTRASPPPDRTEAPEPSEGAPISRTPEPTSAGTPPAVRADASTAQHLTGDAPRKRRFPAPVPGAHEAPLHPLPEIHQHPHLLPHHQQQRPAAALGLAAVALVLLPLLHLIRHCEVALRGLTASLAHSTGAAVALWHHLRRPVAAIRADWHGTAAVGYVLPLPYEMALVPAAAAAAAAPLVGALGLAAVLALATWVGGAPAPTPTAAPGLVNTGLSSSAACWCRVGLLYALALLLPSPAPAAAGSLLVRTPLLQSDGGSGRGGAAVAVAVRQLLRQAARLLLIAVAASWAVAASAGSGTAGAAGREGVMAAGTAVGSPSWAAGLWVVWVGVFWMLHSVGVVAALSG